MYRKLSDVTLKTGEPAELGVLSGPDESELARHLRALLGHKRGIWQWQIEQSLGNENPESRFYILQKNARPFANIMTVEHRGIGIFGHVYTLPDERRKGAAEIIQHALMDDFKQRGGRALYLGTDFDSAPYRLYLKHGFQGVAPGSDYMHWFAQGQDLFERESFAPSPVRHELLAFKHWPLLPALSMMKHSAQLRILGMDVFGPASTEAGSLSYLAAMYPFASQYVDKKEKGMRAHVAVSNHSGLPVALAATRPEPSFWAQTDWVDLFCAPGFEAELPILFSRLQLLPGRSAICYSDPFWPQKEEVLRACGFHPATRLNRHARSGEQVFDVVLWLK